MADDPRDAGLLQRFQEENRRLRERYDRLRSRRSVRMALALAELSGRIRRRIWRRAASPGADSRPQQAPPHAVLHRRAGRQWVSILDALERPPSVTVVVPVFNAYDELADCVEHLLRNTSTAEEILFIDDASSDERVGQLLNGLSSATTHVRVLRNQANLGFVATANRGFAEVGGDVILLNADTRVPPRWVEGLRVAAYSSADVASASALSDNAGAFSAPEAGRPNPLPSGLDPDDAGRLVARCEWIDWPTSPTAHGFCMYVKRTALRDVGGFDADRYPRGYGEENDWSMRAMRQGWRHVVATSTYVAHGRTKSFDADERAELQQRGAEQLAADHPDYQRLVDEFHGSGGMGAARERIARALSEEGARPVRPRVLIGLHDLGGGLPQSTNDLVRGLAPRYEALVLVATDGRLQVSNESGERVAEYELNGTIALEDVRRPDYRTTVAQILVEYGIEVVHIRQLMKHTLDLPEIAHLLDIPVVMSVHDYYLLCPTAHLIDESDRYCAGTCTSGQGLCRSTSWVSSGPHLKHGWVVTWQRRISEMMRHVDVMVAPSRAAADVYRQSKVDVFARMPWTIIEHGRDVGRTPSVASFPTPDEPIRIALAGNIGVYKGANLVRQIHEIDRERRIEFHIFGTLPGSEQQVAVVHGPYPRDEFARRVADVQPAAMAVLSVTPETYSHVLTEAWAAGIPVIVTDRGAPAERVGENGGGWIIDPMDASAAYRHILEIFTDRNGWERRRDEAVAARWPTVHDMAVAHADLYDDLREKRRTAQRAQPAMDAS